MGIAPTKEVRYIDGLNSKASKYGYTSLDSVSIYAQRAYKEAKHYELGKAEACNHLGFYHFMRMNFDESAHF